MLTFGVALEPVVTGGILRSPAWLSIVADLFGCRLWLPSIPESTAFGGVVLGLSAVGACQGLAEAARLVRTEGSVQVDPLRHRAYREVVSPTSPECPADRPASRGA